MALILCLCIIAVGTSGYIFIEDYTILEGIYMSVITITTVGFGEVRPLSEIGRWFTTFIILAGFGCLAITGHSIAEALLENTWISISGSRKMKKKISNLNSHYIICGLGKVGAAAAEHFREAGVDFVIIETKGGQGQWTRENGYFILEGDATREDILLEAGIKSARGLLALLNSDPDNLFSVLSARELNPTLYIIARADDISSEKKIFRAGADSVVSPFSTAGKRIAADILGATGKTECLTDGPLMPCATPQWISIREGSSMLGRTISEVSHQMGQEVVGLRRHGRDFIFPDPKKRIECSDSLLVIDGNGNSENQSARLQHEHRKLVIVDDNPVILRLYSRLFQKAGFYPMTASDGREGLDLIVRERPAAAVIDFMLPALSGIDICRKLRSEENIHDTRLIIFTTDSQTNTKRRALDAGADAVIVKGPEAFEVIEAVTRILEGDQRPKNAEG